MPRARSRKKPDWSQLPNLVTALTAVGALVFTGLSLQATRDQLDIAQTQQITERFTRAVEHLGDERTTDIRLGAVLSLERIARDSAADREAVGHLLTTFVRRKRPLTGGMCAQGLGRDEADVAAALRVVATGQLMAAPDLSATCLSGAQLDEARLRCAVLVEANLQGTTTMVGADLSQADLSGALLNSTNPDDDVPRGAILNDADLQGAKLAYADLSHAYLIEANLRGADLSGTALTGTHLGGADLRGAYLVDADLSEADLYGARWAGARIGGARFDSLTARANALAGGAVDDDTGELPARTCGG